MEFYFVMLMEQVVAERRLISWREKEEEDSNGLSFLVSVMQSKLLVLTFHLIVEMID